MLELLGMQCTPSLPLLPDPLWPGMVAPETFKLHAELFEIELFLTLKLYLH